MRSSRIMDGSTSLRQHIASECCYREQTRLGASLTDVFDGPNVDHARLLRQPRD